MVCYAGEEVPSGFRSCESPLYLKSNVIIRAVYVRFPAQPKSDAGNLPRVSSLEAFGIRNFKVTLLQNLMKVIRHYSKRAF